MTDDDPAVLRMLLDEARLERSVMVGRARKLRAERDAARARSGHVNLPRALRPRELPGGAGVSGLAIAHAAQDPRQVERAHMDARPEHGRGGVEHGGAARLHPLEPREGARGIDREAAPEQHQNGQQRACEKSPATQAPEPAAPPVGHQASARTIRMRSGSRIRRPSAR